MLYGIIADIVVLVHLLWILFLLAGACWGRKHLPVMVVHGAGLVFAVVSQAFGWFCPLTYLEVWLRVRQNAAWGYPGSFIAHYAETLVYIDVSPGIIFALTLMLVGVTAGIYVRAFTRQAL